MQIRTDLAMECSPADSGLSGIKTEQRCINNVEEFIVEVLNEEAAKHIGKPCGRYVTLSNTRLAHAGVKEQCEMVEALKQILCSMLPAEGDILIIGLGNRRITADALGSRVLESLLVTRHMKSVADEALKGRLRGVCAVAPGVLGVTGIETAEVVKGLTEHVKPVAVIAIDALAARETARICSTIQVTDTGIRPGSGVGNHRMGLTKDTLGVPVIAIGVPMVVYASVIARDALALLLDDVSPAEESHEGVIDSLVSRVLNKPLGDLVVTPREVDDMVGTVAEIIAEGVNRALQPRLNTDEISAFAHGKLH